MRQPYRPRRCDSLGHSNECEVKQARGRKNPLNSSLEELAPGTTLARWMTPL